MLKIDLHQLEHGPLSLRLELPPSLLELEESTVRAEMPVSVDLTVALQSEDILVTGRLETTLSVQCGRCGDWIPWPVKIEDSAHSLEIPSASVIDLTLLVREDILLTLPVVASCTLGPGFRCPRSGTVYPPETKQEPLASSRDLWQELDKLKLKE